MSYEYAIEERKYQIPIVRKEVFYRRGERVVEEFEDKLWRSDVIIAIQHVESGELTIFKLYPATATQAIHDIQKGVLSGAPSHVRTASQHDPGVMWKWGDSRQKGAVAPSDVQAELARLLFDGDTEEAADLMEEAYDVALGY